VINIFYYFLPGRKINGTLFYCFEYFEYLNRHKNTTFYIKNISPEDLVMVKDTFKNKYNFDHQILDNIKIVDTISELYEIESTKSLFLDTNSFEKMFRFLKSDVLVYANTYYEKVYSNNKKITYYGTYDYQEYDIEDKLRFNFNIYKEIDEVYTDTAYITSPSINYNKIIDKIDIQESNILTKNVDKPLDNLFEQFDTLYYYHNGFRDTNNRLIVECFHYDKSIVVIDNSDEEDSVYLRFSDIMKNGISQYQLQIDTPIIKDMLE